MPALQSFLIRPLWHQFSALLPPQRPTHPLVGHRPRIDDRVIFDKLIEVLVFGAAYWRIADRTCSATTLRRRRDEWIALGLGDQLRTITLAAYDRMIGLELTDVAVDGCISKAPCGGEMAGPSPVDRAKQGTKRSNLVDANGIPLAVIAARANANDSPLLGPTLDAMHPDHSMPPGEMTVHLDRGYDSAKTRAALTQRHLTGCIAKRGQPAPLMASSRWVVERTNSWQNAFKKLVWCTERQARVIAFYHALANAVIVLRRLIREGWKRYRWEGRPARCP
jgi:transposase